MANLPKNAKINFPDSRPSIGPSDARTLATPTLRHFARPKQADSREDPNVIVNCIKEMGDDISSIRARRLSSLLKDSTIIMDIKITVGTDSMNTSWRETFC